MTQALSRMKRSWNQVFHTIPFHIILYYSISFHSILYYAIPYYFIPFRLYLTVMCEYQCHTSLLSTSDYLRLCFILLCYLIFTIPLFISLSIFCYPNLLLVTSYGVSHLFPFLDEINRKSVIAIDTQLLSMAYFILFCHCPISLFLKISYSSSLNLLFSPSHPNFLSLHTNVQSLQGFLSFIIFTSFSFYSSLYISKVRYALVPEAYRQVVYCP